MTFRQATRELVEVPE